MTPKRFLDSGCDLSVINHRIGTQRGKPHLPDAARAETFPKQELRSSQKVSHDEAVVVARPYSFVDCGSCGKGPQDMTCVVTGGSKKVLNLG